MERIQKSVQEGWLRPWRKLGLAAARHWPRPVSITLNNGRKMFVDLRSGIGAALFVKGEFDPQVFAPIREILNAGGAFLDVGANVGYYSLLALDCVGASGHVHAFEVDSRPLRCLRRTISEMNLQNLSVHELAIGERDGLTRIRKSSDSGHSSVGDTNGGARVPISTLDTWQEIFSAQKVQAIKIDVEGNEFAVLQGAKKILSEQRPLVVCEAVPELISKNGTSADQMISFLKNFDYEVRWLDGAWSPTLVARPLTPSLSPSDGERVASRRVRG